LEDSQKSGKHVQPLQYRFPQIKFTESAFVTQAHGCRQLPKPIKPITCHAGNYVGRERLYFFAHFCWLFVSCFFSDGLKKKKLQVWQKIDYSTLEEDILYQIFCWCISYEPWAVLRQLDVCSRVCKSWNREVSSDRMIFVRNFYWKKVGKLLVLGFHGVAFEFF